MFTGVIQHIGKLVAVRRGKQELVLEAAGLADRLSVGDSLSVNGVCLSLTAREGSGLIFDLSRETLERTTLGLLPPGAPLNLETPLTLSTPLGGHLVTGHVDYRGRVIRVVPRRPGKRAAISLPHDYRGLLAAKGSVAVDGVSLTVAGLGQAAFEVELIPITLRDSSLGRLRPGEEVNVECDIVGKYVYNWLNRGNR